MDHKHNFFLLEHVTLKFLRCTLVIIPVNLLTFLPFQSSDNFKLLFYRYCNMINEMPINIYNLAKLLAWDVIIRKRVCNWTLLVLQLGVEARSDSQVSFTSEVPLSGSSPCKYMICEGGGGSLYISITQSRIRRSMSSRWRPCLNRKSRNHLNKCDSREGSWFILLLWEISASHWFLKIL